MDSSREKGLGLMVVGLALFSVSAITGAAYPLVPALLASVLGWVLAKPFRYYDTQDSGLDRR